MRNRGIDDADEFLNPSDDQLIPFEKLINIDKAAQIIKNGLNNNKRFLIMFDVDNDGLSSGTIIYRYLSKFTDNIGWVINSGKKHGLQEDNMDTYLNTDILIIVDSLNADMELYQVLLDKGIQLIVLDHHMISNIDTNAISLVSSANDYPNKQLSGSGVTWKFCMYLDKILNKKYADQYVDLAASGIISDMCDVSQNSMENRYICNEGFKNLNNTGLKQINGNYSFDSTAVSFGVAPLVNAACRNNQNELAVRLFLNEDTKQIKDSIAILKKYKEKQTNQMASILPSIIDKANKQISKVIYIQIADNFELAGFIGNKLIEKYKKPALVLHTDGDKISGSCRGIGVDDFKSIVNQTGLCNTAGHENAFGIDIDKKNFKKFIIALNKIVEKVAFKTMQYVDVKLSPEDISESLIKKLKEINKITGSGFKPISVLVDGIDNYEIQTMSNGKHLKIHTDDMDYIKWNFTGNLDEFDNVIYSPSLKFVGTLDANWYRGMYNKQMIVSDYRIVNGY